MAEELRVFVRTALYLGVVGVVYWIVSREPAGTVLLIGLALAIAAFVAVAVAMVPAIVSDVRPRGRGLRRAISGLNRAIGFHERVEAPPPLEGGPDLVPLSSAWPIVTAGALVVIGLGLIFGAWLLLPGIVVLVMGLAGWISQLDPD